MQIPSGELAASPPPLDGAGVLGLGLGLGLGLCGGGCAAACWACCWAACCWAACCCASRAAASAARCLRRAAVLDRWIMRAARTARSRRTKVVIGSSAETDPALVVVTILVTGIA